MKNCGSRLLAIAGIVVAGLAVHALAQAADLPSVNLGMTSFVDRLPPAGSGWYGTQYLEYYTAGRVNDNAGNKVGLPKQDIDLFAGLSQLVYQAPLTFGGMHPGLDVILPWVGSVHTDDGIGNVALNARAGFGDLLIGPFVQFDPVMGAHGPRFAQRVEFQFIAPTGAYDHTRDQSGQSFLVVRSVLGRHLLDHAEVDRVVAAALLVECNQSRAGRLARAGRDVDAGRSGRACELRDRV
jgi:hypothetical protein